MRSLIRILAALASVIGLAGCDQFNLNSLTPGVSTAQEVRTRLGPPQAEWPNPDGSTTWEYPRGPEGVHCWMVTLGPDGVLRSIEQALTEENFARIEKGWSGDQVRRLLGKPALATTYPLKPETVWEWKIEAKSPGYRAWFYVHFDPGGHVTGTSRREQSPD
jgi:hypothetical protein